MSRIEYLREEIRKAEAVLVESRENYEKKPNDYSARLLLMSTENYLSDLLRELDLELLKTGEANGDG